MIANRAKRINHFYETWALWIHRRRARDFERKQIRCCYRWWRSWWPFGGSPFVQERLESESFREEKNSRHPSEVRRVLSCQSRDGEAFAESQESRCYRRTSGNC